MPDYFPFNVGGPAVTQDPQTTDPYDDLDLSRYEDFLGADFEEGPLFDYTDPNIGGERSELEGMYGTMGREGLIGQQGRQSILQQRRAATNFRLAGAKKALKSRLARQGRGAYGGGALKELTGDMYAKSLAPEAEFAGQMMERDLSQGKQMGAQGKQALLGQRMQEYGMKYGGGLQQHAARGTRAYNAAQAERGRRLAYLMFREGVIDKNQFAALMHQYQMEELKYAADNQGGGLWDTIGDVAGVIPGVGDALDLLGDDDKDPLEVS